MSKTKTSLFTHIANVVTVALIVECFLCAMMLVNKFGQENCFDRIEEHTSQMNQVFVYSMEWNENNLEVFADILAANDLNSDDLLQTYMRNFCTTQDFSALCIHWADGSSDSYGATPHDLVEFPPFEQEAARLPYISDALGSGDAPEDRFIYHAVPVTRSGDTIGILYGFIPLSTFPQYIPTNVFDGMGQFYIVDGNTGDFLMDEYHGTLSNIFDGSMGSRQAKSGYDMEEMRENIQNGKSGYFIFTSQRTGDWYYTYYMPMGINNWSMQMTIDEPTAFAAYHNTNRMLMVLGAAVIIFMVIHILVLMWEEQRRNKQDRKNLHKSNYINSIQRALINAHNDPGALDQALKIVGEEMDCETVLLLSLSGRLIANAQYWPSQDKAQAMALLGRNIRDDFPMLFDRLSGRESVIYDDSDPDLLLSESAKIIFSDLDVSNILLVPIMDNAGSMKGVLAAVNSHLKAKNCEMLECVTYDFFMAISNLENQAIIQRMGAIDYLTGIKNRNSYESELPQLSILERKNLWCVFIDANGLHELNNTQGHKAGDRMLIAVAQAMKKAFGETHTYRLGGDEFLAFAMDLSRSELLSRKHRIIDELAWKGYSVSIGFEEAARDKGGRFLVDAAIANAEAIMYREKRAYYESHHFSPERGHIPSDV